MRLRPEAAATVVSVDALIDEALLRTLEPAVAALNRVFDSIQPATGERGEPDGISGLEPHGVLARLLASEWLLAAEAPDEFMRRLDQGELGYLRLAHVEKSRPQTSLVLFDAGPDQLGQPRLAQLATLVVLGRRANQAGAELRWGTLQHPGRYPAGGPYALSRLLEARTLDGPSPLPLDAFVDDCLVVSPLAGPPYPAQQLVLSDSGQGVAAELIDRRRGLTRTAHLPLPKPADAVRLLRGRTGTAREGSAPTRSTLLPTPPAPKHQFRMRGPKPVSNLVFDQQGNKLMARIEPNRLVIYPVPHSPNEIPGRVRYVTVSTDPEVVAAAGRVKRSVLTVNVVHDGTCVLVRRFGGSANVPTGVYRVAGGPIETPTADTALGHLAWDGTRLKVYSQAWRLTQTNVGFEAEPADRSVWWEQPGLDAMSATPTADGWLVRCGPVVWSYHGGAVFGAVARPEGHSREEWQMPWVLIVGGGGDLVSAVQSDGREQVLFGAGEPIVDVVAHHRTPIYALRTLSGRVVVRSWHDDTTLYQAYPG